MKAGSLLVFEGIDGSGKSTQLELLASALEAAGHQVVRSAEPYDCEAGRLIRAMARSGRPVAPEQELTWFWEQRREHVRDVIAPALQAGRVVLSDRYFLSTVAYQGARGLDAEKLLAESEAEFPLPALVLLLEITPEAGLSRVSGRDRAHEPVFEDRSFLTRAAGIFRDLDRDYIARIGADRPAADVHRAVAEIVSSRLGLL